jgi:uncharacterized protein (DUF362 family)
MQIADNNKKGTVFSSTFQGWHETLFPLLDASGLSENLEPGKKILLKPNLVEVLDPPITTPVGIVEAAVDYLQEKLPECHVIIGEGCGSLQYDTHHCFHELGYSELAAAKGVELIDLNNESCITLKNDKCRRWPEMLLPELIFDVFFISIPVLKAHSLADVTLTMKNMMGTAPPSRYQQGGSWKKASFHNGVHEAVFDLNRYRCADFTILDATVGMAEAHLWGPTCSPPVNMLAAGWDPVAIDAYGCSLLKRSWQDVNHIVYANGELGDAEYKVETV